MTYLHPRDKIVVLSNHQLVNKVCYRESVWLPAIEANEELAGRGAWLSAITLVYDYADHLYYRNGKRYKVVDIDEEFPDGQNRWMTNFLEADGTGNAPATYSRKYERLRLIELYCRLRNYPSLPACFNSVG